MDIYKLSQTKSPTVVVSNIAITKEGSLIELLKATSFWKNEGDHTYFERLGGGAHYWLNNTEINFVKQEAYGDYRAWFVSKIDTAARLKICDPAQSIRRNEARNNPIHYAAFDGRYRRLLSDSFKKAFGEDLNPNIQYGSVILVLNINLILEQNKSIVHVEIMAPVRTVKKTVIRPRWWISDMREVLVEVWAIRPRWWISLMRQPGSR